MGNNPSTFKGERLPVENISWTDAIMFANAKSKDAGLTPVYTITDDGVSWDMNADGYRLPTEAEWKFACRAGTTTPFNMEKSPGADFKEGLSVHYSGGASLADDISEWLDRHGVRIDTASHIEKENITMRERIRT